jgi:hypothetical protein
VVEKRAAASVAAASYDLFPELVHVSDFENDPTLNAELTEFARMNPHHNSSTSGCNLLDEPYPWAMQLNAIFVAGIGNYLREADPAGHLGRDVMMHVFFNYSANTAFTPVHNHLYDAHLVGIYYAKTPAADRGIAAANDYYALPPGTIVLCSHIPDGGDFDRRGPHTRPYFKIEAKTNRLIVHPATLNHFVTPTVQEERVSVTCNYVLSGHSFSGSYRSASC